MAEENMPQPEAEQDEETALIPRSLLGKDCKPGEEVTFKITHLYDDEAEIAYVQKDKQDSEDKGDYSDFDSAAEQAASDEATAGGY